MVLDLYRVLTECGVEYMELGFVNTRSLENLGVWSSVVPQMLGQLYTLAAEVRAAAKIPKSKPGPKWVLMLDYKDVVKYDRRAMDFQLFNRDLGILRLAVRLDQVSEALAFCYDLHTEGKIKEISLNVMGCSTITQRQLDSLIHSIKSQYRPSILCLADSFGGCDPEGVRNVYENLRNELPDTVTLGFHGHDNLSLALANSMAAVAGGARIIDCTIDGMGRGGGNLRTELAVANWRSMRGFTGIANWIHTHLQEWRNVGNGGIEIMTGMVGVHPNYCDHVKDYTSCETFLKALQNLTTEQARSYDPKALRPEYTT